MPFTDSSTVHRQICLFAFRMFLTHYGSIKGIPVTAATPLAHILLWLYPRIRCQGMKGTGTMTSHRKGTPEFRPPVNAPLFLPSPLRRYISIDAYPKSLPMIKEAVARSRKFSQIRFHRIIRTQMIIRVRGKSILHFRQIVSSLSVRGVLHNTTHCWGKNK